MGYSQPSCKRDGGLLSLTGQGLLCLLGDWLCVPAIWGQVKVVFIPKPGSNSFSGPRDFRPISLTSFLI
jgi:hypothetical protein